MSSSVAELTLENLLYEKKGPIAYVTLNRPKVLNALNQKTWENLRAAFEDVRAAQKSAAHRNPSVREKPRWAVTDRTQPRRPNRVLDRQGDGTCIVLSALTLLYFRSQRIAFPVSSALMLFQAGLLIFLVRT
jgi:hypothetical protein